MTYTGGIYDGVTGLYYLNACYCNPVEAWELLKNKKAKNKRHERLIKAVIPIYNVVLCQYLAQNKMRSSVS